MTHKPDLREQVVDILPVQKRDNGCTYWRKHGICAYPGGEQPLFRRRGPRTKCIADGQAVPFCLPLKKKS